MITTDGLSTKRIKSLHPTMPTRLSTSRTQSLDELTTSTTPNPEFYKLMYICNIIILLISVLTYLTKLYIFC